MLSNLVLCKHLEPLSHRVSIIYLHSLHIEYKFLSKYLHVHSALQIQHILAENMASYAEAFSLSNVFLRIRVKILTTRKREIKNITAVKYGDGRVYGLATIV